MTHRERVMKALSHKEPDRVPIDLGGTTASTILSGAYEVLKGHLGIDTATLFMDAMSSRVSPDQEILERFQVDTRMLLLQTASQGVESMEILDSYEDRWGVVWQFTRDGRYYVVKPPFDTHSTVRDLHIHDWPDPEDPALTKGLRQRAVDLHEGTDYAIVMALPGRAFSLGQHLCGLEDWLVNLLINPRFAVALLDQAVEIESQMIVNILDVVGDNVDVVLCSDDLGMQNGPLISPDLYRKMIKPRHEKLYEVIKGHTEAALLLHSDGAIARFIGDFIDVGVDALNPVQVSAAGMGDTKWLKREFGEHVSFWGAIDTQHILPFGTPDEVRDEVRRRIEDLAHDGGYVLASVHNIQAEVPPENVCAMFKAATEYGSYV